MGIEPPVLQISAAFATGILTNNPILAMKTQTTQENRIRFVPLKCLEIENMSHFLAFISCS